MDIKGVSGTSAGSIVAALVAGGFNGIDLADPACTSSGTRCPEVKRH
ncbi:hypothetical protein [Pseudomonas fluorescens]